MAEAAAVCGEHRYTSPPFPILPGKLRLLVETVTSLGASTPGWPMVHSAHDWFVMTAPASMKTLYRPAAKACLATWIVAGVTMRRVPLATVSPRRTSAAALRSSNRPLVHD